MFERIINANVIDVINGKPFLAALEIENGRVTSIAGQTEWTEDEQALDLKGKYLSPGFIDTHSHLITYSSFRKQLDCSPENVGSISEIIEKFKADQNQLLVDGWLRGYGYNEYELDEGRHPDRFDLDRISTEIPIYIQHNSAHMGTVNTKALELIGVGLDEADPKGGRYGRDENGQVNGGLFEFPAMAKLMAILSDADSTMLAENIEAGAQDYLSKGITNTTEMFVGMLAGETDYKGLLKYLEKPQKIRTRWAIDYNMLQNMPELKDATAQELEKKFETLSNGYSTLEGAKFFSDGSIQLNTASIRGDYYNGAPSDELQLEQDALEALYHEFQARGFPLITHANGDYAARTVIEAYKNTRSTKTTEVMNRVEHIQTVTPQDIQEMVDNNIGGSFFSNHLYYFGDIHKNYSLGPERVQDMNPVRWAEDQGMTFTIHSDCPVTDVSPLGSMKIVTERKTRNGEILGQHQKLSRAEAYRKMTIDAAKLNGTEGDEGSIEEGKLADFVVLKQNPLDETVMLDDGLVEQTIVAGEVVFKK
ncbi:amidohydrolase [Salinicoccus albus]|uniref:amidohydrolase n=1 Tax=Salinicoccus albus TaxID=418756 RepID=UPI0003731BA5|nr:amidohydrolase [Salinicoccus albus]